MLSRASLSMDTVHEAVHEPLPEVRSELCLAGLASPKAAGRLRMQCDLGHS